MNSHVSAVKNTNSHSLLLNIIIRPMHNGKISQIFVSVISGTAFPILTNGSPCYGLT